VKDLLGLLLGRAHAVSRRAVGLRNPLAGPCLGQLAQLPRRPFGSLEDARNPPGRVRRPRLFLGRHRRGGLLRLHGAMVEAPRSAGRQGACEPAMAENVGNLSLRTERASAMIE